jgi:hypothetical protein
MTRQLISTNLNQQATTVPFTSRAASAARPASFKSGSRTSPQISSNAFLASEVLMVLGLLPHCRPTARNLIILPQRGLQRNVPLSLR